MNNDAQARCNENPTENYFGCCPECGRHDGYVNIGKGHWFFCREHKTRWYVGANLFSIWRDETEEKQRAKSAMFFEGDGYIDVKPVIPTNMPEAPCIVTASKA